MLAGPAAETSIDVSFKCVRVVAEAPFTHGAHQIKTAAWSIVLISGDDVGRTGFKAEAAVNAGQQLLFFGS